MLLLKCNLEDGSKVTCVTPTQKQTVQGMTLDMSQLVTLEKERE